MNVAILMPRATQRGGAEQLLDVLLQHTADADIEWLVIFFEHGPLVSTFSERGVETLVVETGRLRNAIRYIRAVCTLTRLLLEEEADLVFSWMSKAHLYGGWAARRAKIPAMWYQHGIPDPAGLMDRLITLVPARRVFACSEQAAEAQRQLWPTRPTSPASARSAAGSPRLRDARDRPPT